MQNAGLDQSHAKIKIPRRNISNLRYADDTTLMVESEEELKSLLNEGNKGTETHTCGLDWSCVLGDCKQQCNIYMLLPCSRR